MKSVIRVGLVLLMVFSFYAFSSNLKPTADSSVKNEPVTNPTPQAQLPYQGPSVLQAITSQDYAPTQAGVKVPIIFYHYIEINPNPIGDPGRTKLAVTPANFESQLIYLRNNGWNTITLDDLQASFSNPKLLPNKPIILTFDDGYHDFYQNAWPLLQRYNFKSTLYIISRANRANPSLYLSDQEIVDLSASPLITIACHTEDHQELRGKSIAFQRNEIFGCKSDLESLIGKPVTHFAYPYGSYDFNSVKIVKEAGFITAATTNISSYNNAALSLTLNRVRMGDWPGTSQSFQDSINLNR